MFAKSRKTLSKQLIALQCLALSLTSSCGYFTEQRPTSRLENRASVELTISAATSMQSVLAKIKALYFQKYPQINLTFNFASSGALQHQIEQGAPIDIFISAAPQQMNILESKKLLLAHTRKNLVQNQMVLVVPEDNQSIFNFLDLAKKSTERVALGEPSIVPAGQYAQEILSSLEIGGHVKPKSVYGKNVRQVLNYVATGNVDAGIVYRTEARVAKEVKVIAIASENNHSAVIYPAAVVKDSSYPKAAYQLLQFLLTPEAQAIFNQYGFRSIDCEK